MQAKKVCLRAPEICFEILDEILADIDPALANARARGPMPLWTILGAHQYPIQVPHRLARHSYRADIKALFIKPAYPGQAEVSPVRDDCADVLEEFSSVLHMDQGLSQTAECVVQTIQTNKLVLLGFAMGNVLEHCGE